MDDKNLALLIFEAIHALKIDVPIMSVVLIGDERIRLSLYGGEVVEYPSHLSLGPFPEGKGGADSDIANVEPCKAHHPAVRDLEGMETVTLRDLAKRKGIQGCSKKSRAALIAALKEMR